MTENSRPLKEIKIAEGSTHIGWFVRENAEVDFGCVTLEDFAGYPR